MLAETFFLPDKPQNLRVGMASESKKRKAKNSYIINGGEKEDTKMKRIMYFNKLQRNKNKKINFDEYR